MEFKYGTRTATGPHRDLNEDAVIAAPPVFGVADGMGGHAAGEVAASIAIDTLAALAGRSDVHREDILITVQRANEAILAAGAADPSASGMGTTLAGLCFGSVGGTPHWLVVNVGDSRVYRYMDATLRQVTVDHSEVAELIAAGRMTQQDARHHPLRNVVTRSLGTDPGPVADIWVMPVVVGERFLLCSDGLPLEVQDETITAILGSHASPQEAADRLVQAAIEGGGHDNVSAVIVDVPKGAITSVVDVTTSPRVRLQAGQA